MSRFEDGVGPHGLYRLGRELAAGVIELAERNPRNNPRFVITNYRVASAGADDRRPS